MMRANESGAVPHLPSPETRNPSMAAAVSVKAIADKGLPRNATEVAERLQRRLSGFALVMGMVSNDVAALERLAFTMSAGFDLSEDDRRELAAIACRLFDAREVLG